MTRLRHWACLLMLFSTCWATLTNWTSIISGYDDAVRSQRDVSKSIPLDQLTSFGVSLNEIVFEKEGYNTDALMLVGNLLESKVGTIMVDLYWNEFTQVWQLCPAPIPANMTSDLAATVLVEWNGRTYRCEPGFSVTHLMTIVRTYLTLSNVELDANIVQIALNLKSIYHAADTTVSLRNGTSSTVWEDSVPSEYESSDSLYLLVGNETLQQSLSVLGSFLFTPTDLDNYSAALEGNYTLAYDSPFPTQNTFLFSLYKRAVAVVINNEIRNSTLGYSFTAADGNTTFFPGSTDFEPWVQSSANTTFLEAALRHFSTNYSSTVFSNLVLQSQFRFAIDNDSSAFTPSMAHQYLQCGFSSILNATNYLAISKNATLMQYENSTDDDAVLAVVNEFFASSFWTWALGQPLSIPGDNNATNLSRRDDDDDDDNTWYTASSKTAYHCATTTTDGWAVLNCYDKYRYACRNNSDPFHWVISDSLGSYFLLTGDICPDSFSFGTPLLAVEQFALRALLYYRNVLYPVWVDLNDITIPGCFVTGGPYATCPYKQAVSTGSLLKRIAPSITVVVVIMVLWFCEKFLITTPIHTNRKRHWKKTITSFYKENDYEGVPS